MYKLTFMFLIIILVFTSCNFNPPIDTISETISTGLTTAVTSYVPFRIVTETSPKAYTYVI
jgi:hypothetical protein